MSSLESLQREVAAAEAIAAGARGAMTVGNDLDRARVSRYRVPGIIAGGLIFGWYLGSRLKGPRTVYAARSPFSPAVVPVHRRSLLSLLSAGSRLVPLAWPLAMRGIEHWRTLRAVRYVSPD